MSDHYIKGTGKEFDAQAIVAEYELGRPGYTHQAVQWIFAQHVKYGGDRRDLTVAEAGTGTGLFTVPLSEVSAQNDMPSVARIYSYDSADKMIAAAKGNERLSPAFDDGLLIVQNGKLQETGLADNSIDIHIAAQTQHWGTRNQDDFSATVGETMRIIKDCGSVFAVYNAPVSNENDFTSGLNRILADKCPDPYYQALSAGDWDEFLGDAGKSNLGKFFEAVAKQGDGVVVQTTMANPVSYADVETITSYVFSNAFVQKAVAGKPELTESIKGEVAELFAKHAGEDGGGGVYYGNTTFIIGAVDLHPFAMQF